MTQTLLVRTSDLPKGFGVAHLRGNLGGTVNYREDVLVAGVTNGLIIKNWSLHSKAIDIPLDLSRPVSEVSRQCPLTLKTIRLSAITSGNPVLPTTRTDLIVSAQVELPRRWSDRRNALPLSAYKARLFDAKGKKVASSEMSSFSFPDRSTFQFDMNFSTDHKNWKKWPLPLTL